MKLEFIEVGQIVNTHGVRGELKLNPWDVEPEVLRREFPERKIEFHIPDEQFKRHGQAVIAASLPALGQ